MAARLAAARAGHHHSPVATPSGYVERDYKALWWEAVKKIRLQNKASKMESYLGLKSTGGRVFLLFGNFLFVILFYNIITHTIPITDLAATTGGVNAFVSNMVTYTKADGSEGNLGNVCTLDDVVNYSEALTKALLTGIGYRGERQEDEKLMLLRVHRLLNTIVLTQRRVRPSDCSYQKMKPLYEDCYEGLDSGNEITEGVQLLKNGVEIPYDENMGGFGVPLQLHQETALEEIQELREGMFWDRATREFSVMFAFHNSPGHYTGSVMVKFEMSPYGEVSNSVDAQFLRMRPYSAEVNGGFYFGLQLCGLFFFAVMVSWYVYGIVKQPHVRWMVAKIINPWGLLELICIIMMFMVIFSWIGYMNDPIRTSFNFESDSYQNVMPLAARFGELIFLMAAVLLLLTMRLIEFFAEIEIDKIQKLKRIIEAIIGSLMYFMVIFLMLFVGFVLAAHILFGPVEPRFNGLVPTSQTLSLWFATLSGGQRAMMELNGGTFFISLFVMVMIVLLFNMFIAIVMAAYDEVLAEEEDPWAQPFDHWLADKICDKFGVSKFKNDPYHKDDLMENFEYNPFASAVRQMIAARKRELGEESEKDKV